MLPVNLALVSEVEGHDPSDVSRVAAALQKQVTRDFSPVWNVKATVDALPLLKDVPIGYWPMIIRDDIGFAGAAGIHLDQDGQPFALIQMSDSWSLTASHECLEMLADPFGNRVIAGTSLKRGQGRVEYLVEVCDPPEDARFAYSVNGILVSDFYTPRFFDPVHTAATRYSFTGAISRPREVLRGGYLSWHEPVSDHWWQQTWFGARKEFRDLGVLGRLTENIRSEIDRRTETPEVSFGLKKTDTSLKAAVTAGKAADKSTEAKADSWRRQIEEIKTAAGR